MYKDQFAKNYDILGCSNFSQDLLPRLLSSVEKDTPTCLEAACGTGELAIRLSEQGWKMYAFDVSEAMIEQARRKRGSDKVSFDVQDMRNFRYDTRFDLAVCFYDSVNHLAKAEEWLEFFTRVFQHLKEGGKFIFDLNTVAGLKRWATSFEDKGEMEDGGQFRMFFEGDWYEKEQSAELYLTAEIDQKGEQEKFREHLVEYTFPFSKVRELLQEAGFSSIEFWILPSHNDPDLDRRLFLECKK